MSSSRLKLIERLTHQDAESLIMAAGPVIGLRDAEEIVARAQALLEDAATAPIPADHADRIDDLLRLSAPAPQALARLRDLGVEMPAIRSAVDRLEARFDALEHCGVRLSKILFEASLGRATMEYYDGFVFSFRAPDPALPPVASGGRYDALTRVLGQGRSIPAVGGVIRPGLVAQLKEGRA
jgi:ATP phosphoribosyltransferase regulatory subunit